MGNVARYSTDGLFSLISDKPRRGRRTNAEHAIGFYRYMLSLNDEGEDGDDEKEDEAKPAPKRKRVSKRVETSEEETEGSVLSMDSEEFLNQHNDLCEVCNDAGELICCSTCNLVFHQKCIRPVVKRLPSGE